MPWIISWGSSMEWGIGLAGTGQVNGWAVAAFSWEEMESAELGIQRLAFEP